eukprot:EG_transcript_21955
MEWNGTMGTTMGQVKRGHSEGVCRRPASQGSGPVPESGHLGSQCIVVWDGLCPPPRRFGQVCNDRSASTGGDNNCHGLWAMGWYSNIGSLHRLGDRILKASKPTFTHFQSAVSTCPKRSKFVVNFFNISKFD